MGDSVEFTEREMEEIMFQRVFALRGFEGATAKNSVEFKSEEHWHKERDSEEDMFQRAFALRGFEGAFARSRCKFGDGHWVKVTESPCHWELLDPHGLTYEATCEIVSIF